MFFLLLALLRLCSGTVTASISVTANGTQTLQSAEEEKICAAQIVVDAVMEGVTINAVVFRIFFSVRPRQVADPTRQFLGSFVKHFLLCLYPFFSATKHTVNR